MNKIIKEVRRKGNENETLILSMYEVEGIINVDLDVITAVGRVNMAKTEHKTLEGAEKFFDESLKAMGDVYGYDK